MNKKRTIQRRGLSAVLALSVCFGLLPPTAGAAVTAEHDWEIFDASDTTCRAHRSRSCRR